MIASLANTDTIVSRSEYFPTVESFFGNFSNAYLVRCQVLKLERRQSYQEPDNPSYEALMAGDFDRAITLLPVVRNSDDELFASLQEKRVEFVRCRPLDFPLTNYLKWEMAAYRINFEKGERIFCCNFKETDFVFLNNAKHDFMVFDAKLVLIHDYNDDGQVQGGWRVDAIEDIQALISLFGFIRAHCRPYDLFQR